MQTTMKITPSRGLCRKNKTTLSIFANMQTVPKYDLADAGKQTEMCCETPIVTDIYITTHCKCILI